MEVLLILELLLVEPFEVWLADLLYKNLQYLALRILEEEGEKDFYFVSMFPLFEFEEEFADFR